MMDYFICKRCTYLAYLVPGSLHCSECGRSQLDDSVQPQLPLDFGDREVVTSS